jgi:hypothetical protein
MWQVIDLIEENILMQDCDNIGKAWGAGRVDRNPLFCPQSYPQLAFRSGASMNQALARVSLGSASAYRLK